MIIECKSVQLFGLYISCYGLTYQQVFHTSVLSVSLAGLCDHFQAMFKKMMIQVMSSMDVSSSYQRLMASFMMASAAFSAELDL